MTEDLGRIDIRAILLSEDISIAQSNNRASLINVYSGAQLVHGSFPVPLQVGITVVMVVEKAGEVPLEIEFSGDAIKNKTKKFTGSLTSRHVPPSDRPEITTVSLGVTWLVIEAEGSLEIRCRQPDQPWKLERVYRFKHRPLTDDQLKVLTMSATTSSASSVIGDTLAGSNKRS